MTTWASEELDVVKKVKKDGSAWVVLAESQRGPSALALDATFGLLAEQGGRHDHEGAEVAALARREAERDELASVDPDPRVRSTSQSEPEVPFMGALVQIRVGPGDVVARIDEHAIEFRCEDRLAVQYDGIHGTTWPVAGGQEATIAAVERAGGHLINVADAHWLHQRPRRPKDHDGESVILEPIRAGYIGGIVVLIRFAADSALRKAHLRVPGYFRRHHYDLDLRGVTLEGEARDELLRHLAAELGAGRVAVAGRPLRVPRRPFRWSDRIFIEKTSPSLASLAWAVIMHLRGKGMPLVAMGLVLSAALVVTGLHEALYRPRSPSRPRG